MIMNRKSIFFLFLFLFVVYCKKENAYNFSINKISKKISVSIVDKMSNETLVQQMLMLYVPLSINKQIINLKPGGIFVYTNNIPNRNNKQDIKQLKIQIKKINSWYIKNNIPPPFYSIDQENGHVRRVKRNITLFPSQMALFEATNKNKIYYIKQMAYYTCIDLKAMGISWNLAPVLDLINNINNPIVRTRGFASNIDDVIDAGRYYLEGLHLGGCIDAIKHFPGHGDTSSDSHKILPQITKNKDLFESNDLYAFRYFLNNNYSFAVMPGHLKVPAYSNQVASLSKYWLQEVIRQKFKFKGMIISDDLSMNAVSGKKDKKTFQELAVKSVQAGVDVLLLFSQAAFHSEDLKIGLINAINNKEISRDRLKKSVERILYYKIITGLVSCEKKMCPMYKFLSQYKNKNLQLKISKLFKLMKLKNKNILTIEKDFISRKELNTYLSEKSIKLLKKGSDYTIKNQIVFTNLDKSNEKYNSLKKISSNIFSIQTLLDEKKMKQLNLERIIILDINKKKMKNIIEKIRDKYLDKDFVIYTTMNPFPFSSLGAYLKKNDNLIASFSDTPRSQKALVDNFISNKIPDKSLISYIKSISK